MIRWFVPLMLATAVAACRAEPRSDGSAQSGPLPGDSSAAASPELVDTSAVLAVTAPAAGAVWEEGGTYVIRWVPNPTNTVGVSVAVGGKDRGHLALGLAPGTDSLCWTIPEGFVSGFGPSRSDAVRIRIEDSTDPARSSVSDTFSIIAAGS